LKANHNTFCITKYNANAVLKYNLLMTIKFDKSEFVRRLRLG